jgi:hypothetical protein
MFVTIGYGDQNGYHRTTPAVRDAAHAHDARMKQAGTFMGIAQRPVQVRNADGARLVTESGPYLRSDLPVAGFAVIEAESLEHAIELASKSPCAVAHGVIEVWPIETSGGTQVSGTASSRV